MEYNSVFLSLHFTHFSFYLVNGTAAECMSLTVAERKSIAEEWLKHGRSK